MAMLISIPQMMRRMMRAAFEKRTGARQIPQHRSVREPLLIALFPHSSSYGASFTTTKSHEQSRYFCDVSLPPQHRTDSSAQQQIPKHSLRFSCTLRVFHTTNAIKKVKLLIQSMIIQTVAKRQNERRAQRELNMPKAKARLVVADVMVMAGPAIERASWTLL